MIEMSIFGKCTDEIKTRLPFEAANDFARSAHDAGMNESEYLRMVIFVHLYGEDEIRRLQDKQLQLLAKRGLKIAQK